MTSRKSKDKLVNELQSLSSWDFKVAFGLAVFAAMGSALFTTYHIGFVDGYDYLKEVDRASSGVWSSGTHYLHTLNLLHLIITAALITSAIGLWFREVISFFLSALALLGVGVTYVWWYTNSIAYLRNSEISDFPADVPHIGRLREAVPWDIIVIAIAIIIFTWQMKILLTIVASSRDENN